MGKSNEVGAIPYEKANNVEYSLFQTHGRITRKAFFFRLFLCVIVWLIFHAVYVYWDTPNYNDWVVKGGGKIQAGAAQIEMRHKIILNIDFYVIPSILLVFMLIQAVKRSHDVNRSGWFLLVPFYNLLLMLDEGTDGDNDYGLVPHPEKKSPSYRAN
ncbi:MAG: DUF805 domain-containing protein [Prevotellaceae bacterium]|jgi:uncharacterized membrane protein YhaH (DUF805 family)|nr:DUF805 domain-containing protein [Prevotellaceae bacterium]